MYSSIVFLLIFGITASSESVINNTYSSTSHIKQKEIHNLTKNIKPIVTAQYVLKVSLTSATGETLSDDTKRFNIEFKTDQQNNSEIPKTGSSTVVAVHSQSYIVNECPANFVKLWEGYSLLNTDVNGILQNQDLGKPGSCVRKFSTSPLVSCNLEDNNICYYAARTDRSYWLSTNALTPMKPLSRNDIHEYISRCVVCEAPANVMAVHSQSGVIPDCPQGWLELWTGYSFVMYGGAGTQGGGLPLESPGSCLITFKTSPVIECENGACYKYVDHQSYWLAAISHTDQFVIPTSTVYRNGYMYDLISRCAVCLKRPQ